jgi:hypothetical protein
MIPLLPHLMMKMTTFATPRPITAQTKLDHLTKIESPADKALQMLLWEIGFDFNVLAHQFEAIRFVAGVVRSFPLAADQCDNNVTWQRFR